MKKLNGGNLMSKVILRKNKRDLGNYNIKMVIIKIQRRLNNLYIIIKMYNDHWMSAIHDKKVKYFY